MDMIDKIIASEQKNFDRYHAATTQEMQNAAGSRRQFYEFLKHVRAD